MLEITLLEEDKIAVIDVAPPLEAADFENAARRLDPEIERLGGLNGVMILAPEFPHWEDYSALWSHLRFVRNHHRDVTRVALVSDASAFKALPVFARLFVSAEIRHFDTGEDDDAREWLASPMTPSTAVKFHRSQNPPLMWIEIDGKITTDRYQELKAEMEKLIEEQSKGSFLVRLKRFDGIEPRALWEDLKFGVSHFRNFKRIAIVGDAGWLDRVSRISNAIMPGEIRAFPEDREEQAWDWVKGVLH